MARGNDPDAARELKERYGTSGNAEDLIDANRARRDPIVSAASRLPIDEEATAKLKLSEIDAPGDVVDAAVHGRYVSFVYEDPSGRLRRGATVRKGLKKNEKEAAESQAGELSAAEAVSRAHAERDAEVARIRAEFEQKLEEAVAKARADGQADADKRIAEAQAKVSDAAADADKSNE